MYVMQLVGRAADSVVEMPFHVAQIAITNGTCRKATEAEILAAGLGIPNQAPPLDTADVMPEGYSLKPFEHGGFDLFDPGGIRLNDEPYANAAAARSAAIEAVDMHVTRFVPIEEVLSPEMQALQLAQRPTRQFTTADYEARPTEDATDSGPFHVYDPGGIRLTEDPVPDIAAAREFAAEHLALMLAQGEGPDADGDVGNNVDEEVQIPADWESLHHMKIRAFARLIAGEELPSLDAAKAAIRDYVAAQNAP